MVQSGYFDGGTPYFDAKYTMWNLDKAGKLQDRMRFHGYGSGHMMYLRSQDIVISNEDIRQFIKDAVPEAGTPAKY
jgi:carboxypeptidase C (cathepsin A)